MDLHHPTKTRHILYLAKQGLNSKEIASLVYPGAAGKELSTRMSYVRVVVRQRKGASLSQYDRAYVARTRDERNQRKRQRYHADAEFRARTKATNKAWTKRRNAARKAWLAEHRPR